MCTKRKIIIEIQKGLTSPQYLYSHKIIGHTNVCGYLNSERENPSKHINIIETYAHKKNPWIFRNSEMDRHGIRKTKKINKGIRINTATNFN